MIEASPRTLYVESALPIALDLAISELHANFWIDSSKEITVDIGLRIRIPVEIFKSTPEIDLKCALQLPAIESSLRSLDSVIEEDDVARWLFNDAIKVQRLGAVGSARSASVVTYRSTPFYLIPSKSAMADAAGKVVTIKLHLASVADRIEPTFDDATKTRVTVYTRFQYKTSEGSSGYQFTRGALRDHLFLDLRFNDARGMPPEVVSDGSFLKIETVRIFLIHRFSSAVQLAPKAKWKQYERLLEHRGKELESYLAQPSKWKKQALIHQWKLETTEDASGVNALIILRAEKSEAEKGWGIVILMILGYFLLEYGYKDAHDAIKSIVDGLVAFAIAALLALIVDFIIRASQNE